MTRPDLDAILPSVSAEDEATVDALLAKAREGVGKRTYTIGETERAQRIATLEHMLAEERANVDTLRARVAELEALVKPKRWKWGPNPESAFFAKAHVEAIECLTPDAKCDVREWRVRCLQCTRVFDMAERTIRNLGKRRYGCRGCYEDKIVTPRAERRRTRFFAKLASE